MKKVVLLAGAIAAGMAIAPQAANAAAPELNDVQEVNLTDQEISAAITTANNQIAVLEGIKATTGYAAAVDAADQTAINYAINDLKALIEQMDMVIDGNILTNSDYFRNTSGIGYSQGDLRVDPSAAGTPDYIKRYAGAGLVQGTSTCKDVVDAAIAAVASNVAAAQAALAAHMGTMTPAEILDANATTAGNVDKTDLENILEEALDILGAYDTNYQDPAGDKSDIYDADIYGGKDGAINTKFDATVKGQIEAAKQLLERIEAAKNKDLTVDDTLDDQLLNQFELQTDVNVLTPLLEGYVVTFKIEANHVAAENVKDALTTELGKLEHHKACKHTDTHKVADEIQNVIDQLDPDAAWDAELDLHVRANSNPLAVQAWEAHLNGTSIPEVSTLYKKALGWDVTDLAEAIDAFQDRFNALDDCDVKTSIGTFLWSGTAVAGTVAKEFNDLKTEIMALGTTVTPAQFAALDQRVTDLYDRLANVEKAWEDLAKLNADDAALQKEIDDAKTEKGYSSTTIKNKWETGEQPELDTLEGNIDAAILAITKDAEFTGYDTFEPTIKLEYDHHKWLADYQEANYEAWQTMLTEIDLREKEYNAARLYHIDSDDPENPNALGFYTTTANKGVSLESILGEDATTKKIYAAFGENLGFSHIDGHFTDHTGSLATAPTHDGWEADLKTDRINKWYNDADAEYIGSKDYTTGWATANHLGKLKDNTVEGIDIDTKNNPSHSIEVIEPAAKADVVFGWLQKEIHTTFVKALENEKANKDIHDKVQEAKDYIADGKDLINTEAHLTITATDVPAREYDTYDMAARKDVMDPEAAYTTNSYLNYEGEYRSLKANNFKVEADLGADFYTKEAEQTAPTNTSVDYIPEFDCGHNLTETPNDHVWGWDKIGAVMLALEDLEKKEYDKVASLALLNGTTKSDLDGDGNNETFEELLTEVKENVDDITNEAFTQLYKNGLALVQQELVDAKAWAAALDAECEEHAADHPCSALDVKNNPCGWDNTSVEGDAYSMLKAIVEAWNEERALIATTDHNAEENDLVAKRDAFTAYVVKALNDIRDWKTKFAAMDKEHKIKLNAALDLAKKEALTMEHYAQEAKNAKANFSVDGADKATADNWAVDFNERKFPFVDGQEHTFVEILKVLKADIDAAHVHVTPPYADDKYAGLEEVLANGITCFDDYIKATDFVKKLSEDYAEAKYNHHLYTDLKTFADGLEKFNWQADFNKWIEANKDCHVRMETVLADLEVKTAGIDIEASELYGAQYTGTVENTTKAQLEALRDQINTLIANQKEAVLKLYKDGEAFEVKDHQPGNINAVEVLLADGETKAKYDPTAIQNKINALNTALAEAKKLYADNIKAQTEKKAEIENLQRSLNEFVVAEGTVYSTAYYTGDKAAWTKEALEGVINDQKTAVETAKTNLENAFNAGTAPAYVVPATIGAALDQNLKDLEAAKKYYADNVAAKDRLLLEVAAVVEANGLVVVDLNNTAMYAADKALITNAEGTGLEEQFLAAVAVEKGNPVADTAAEKLGHFGVEFNAGTIAANEATEMLHVQGLIAQNAAIADAILKAANHYAEEHALFNEYSEKVNNLETLRDALTTTVWAVYDDIDLNKDGAALRAEVQAINEAILAERQALKSDVEVGTVKDHAADYVDAVTGEDVVGHDNAIDAIETLIQTLEDHIKEYEKFYADEHAEANKYNDKVNNLETLRDALTTTVWAVYDDIENGKDGVALHAEAQAITEAIAAERAALDTDLLEGNVQAHAADYVDAVTGEDVVGHDNAIDAIETLIQTLEEHIAEYEKFYVDEHKLADKYNDELNNLETLRDALGTVWNAYDTLEDLDKTDKTLAALRNDYLAISEALAAERAAVAADLEAGNVQAHATTDYTVEEDGVAVEKKAHETAINNIAEAIKKLQDKVRDIEQFKAENKEKAAELTNDFTNLLAVLEGMHKYGDVYPEDKAIIDYLLDNADIRAEVPEGVKAAVLGLVERVKAEVANVADDLENGRVVDNYENYKDAIANFKADIEDLKQVIAEAETLYAENLRALNNLEEHAQAVKTAINTVKAQSACSECDALDMAELEKLLNGYDDAEGNHVDGVYDIEDDFNESFNVDKNLNKVEVYMDYTDKLGQIETALAGIKAEIALHLDRVQNDLRVYNTLQTLLVSVDAEMLNLEAEEGYKCFANRDAYHNEDYNPERPHFHEYGVSVGTNPNVKYGNELTKMVEDLKAEIERQHSHEGGHICEENKIADVKAMNDIKAEIEKTIAAIKANEAAHQLLQDRFAELFEDAKDAYNFWHQYYSPATLITHEYDIAQWIKEWNGVLENGDELVGLENLLHDYYVHGNAANAWTVDGKGEELNGDANDKFAEYDEALANDRNELAHTEALNHAAQVTDVVMTYVNNTEADYTAVDAEGFSIEDPFVKEVLVDWKNDVTGKFGLIASLNTFKADIEAAYEEGVMEDAINIDNHNTALGIHQQLDGVLGVLSQIEADYAKLFEDAHHLTNGKTLYSDMQYVTIGFFRKANEGLGEQATEMFKVVEPHFVAEEGNIGIYDLNRLETTPVDPNRGVDEADVEDVELPEYAKDLLLPVRDENDYLVHQEGLGVIPAEVGVLGHGDKKNELTFTLNDEYDREVVTLAAGPADITFKPGSLSVYDEYNNEWLTKHNVYVEINVEAPQVEVEEADVTGQSNKLIVRLNAPIDLTYTINSLVAKTDKGEEFSYADRVINYAANTLEFDLPAGTESVELPEGFFTFRTGENSIARSAAMVVAVGGIQTSIDAIIAMGEKAEIFDLQGRRVKAESLLSGNAYVVNGQKVVVK